MNTKYRIFSVEIYSDRAWPDCACTFDSDESAEEHMRKFHIFTIGDSGCFVDECCGKHEFQPAAYCYNCGSQSS